MEYSKHELGTINMIYPLKKLSFFTPSSPSRPPHHKRPLYPKVADVEKTDCIIRVLYTNDFVI